MGVSSPVPRVGEERNAGGWQFARVARGRILKLVCQGACGLGGQDWEGPHDLVGRLVLGHTALVWFGGWGRQFILRTAPRWCVSRVIGSDPTQVLTLLVGDV